MALVNIALSDRASVSRTESIIDEWGNQKTVSHVIATGVACKFVRSDWQTSYADVTNASARAVGVMFTDPNADVTNGDTLTIGTKRYTLLSAGGIQTTLDGQKSHGEFACKQLA